MKKILIGLVLAFCLVATRVAVADVCTTIQDGTLYNTAGQLLTTGYDDWGYNYQARIFNGTYCDAYRNAPWCQPYKDVELEMKWSDAWLSNRDCDGNGMLDRHYGFSSYIGSGAWVTNHQAGSYLDDNGKKQRWNYFVKIIAVPADAKYSGGVWYAADGTEIGPSMWNEFAVIQEVYNDTGAGSHGLSYHSPLNSGFGSYGPQH